MAIYVLFKCLRCAQEGYNSEIRVHLYSCSRNKDNINRQLCEHFDVFYSYECHWGIFTFGWKIIINVKHKCRNCGKTRTYDERKCNSKNYSFAQFKDCCYNVFSYTVRGYDYDSGEGYELQKVLDEQLRKMRIEKESEERKRREQLENKRKEERIINEQEEENNKYTEEFETISDINWIEKENEKIMMNEETKFSVNITFNIKTEINKISNYKIVKA